MYLSLVTNLVLSLTEVNRGSVVSIDKDLLESEAKKIVGSLLDVLPVLSDKLAGGLREDKVDLLEGLVLGLGHEEELVEPSEDTISMIPRIRTPRLSMRCSLRRSSPRYCREAYPAVKPGRIRFGDLPNKCDTAIESSSQADIGERLLHRGEVVCDDEG
jgi:hypothetical protein